jgi:hypothetical protein
VSAGAATADARPLTGGRWLRRVPAWALTAVLGLAYVIAAPPAPDLAAASYRSWLISTSGLGLWDNSWYGGHHLPAYSLLSPALGALIGPQLLAAISMVVATALFAALIEGRFPSRSTRIAAWWFALGASVSLLSCRVPFNLGLALALGALLAAQRGRMGAAVPLSAVAAVASPVAGAFLALAYVTWGIRHPPRRPRAALALAVVVPVGVLELVFPEGGTQPFVASAFYPAVAGVIVIALLAGREQPDLRLGAWLYALAMSASYVIPSAMGGNADRLGALAAGPVAACALAGPNVGRARRMALLALAPLLLYWQANAPVADFASAIADPATESSFYTPLLDELRTLGVGYGRTPARIEVVPSADHWEARWVAPHVMLARGWERQLDRYRNGLFYEESQPLTAARYDAWLSAEAVSYVALPDSPLDYSARAEASLLRASSTGRTPAGTSAVAPTPDLRELWSSRHWRLFAVTPAPPLAQPPAALTALGRDSFTLRVPGPGSYVVRVRFTPYWKLTAGSGCVSRAGEDWTRVQARAKGSLHVAIGFSLVRVFWHGARCT